MNLDFFKEIGNILKSPEVKEKIDEFLQDLNNFLENCSKSNTTNQSIKYSEYWDYQKFMEDNVAANIGISKCSTDIRYHDELSEAIDDSILKLSESEGVLYRKQFVPNGPINNPIYNVDKYENGKIEHLTLSAHKVPKGFDNEDIIFKYKSDGSPEVRWDLKEKAVKFASEHTEYLKVKEKEKALDYKIEGHIYKAVEDDGYIFLQDLTEPRDYVLEDIDFVVDSYQGEGKYKVINGEYKKIS